MPSTAAAVDPGTHRRKGRVSEWLGSTATFEEERRTCRPSLHISPEGFSNERKRGALLGRERLGQVTHVRSKRICLLTLPIKT